MAWELGKPQECSNKIFLVLMFSSYSLCCCFPPAEEVQEEGMWNSFSASPLSRSSAWWRCAPRFCNVVEENKRQEKDGSAGRGLFQSFAHVALRVHTPPLWFWGGSSRGNADTIPSSESQQAPRLIFSLGCFKCLPWSNWVLAVKVSIGCQLVSPT